MPKLDKKQQKSVESAQAWGVGGFLLPEGRYAARLAKVEERPGNKAPYWSWEFRHLHDENGAEQRGRQWLTTSLSQRAFGGLKQAFDAFGYTVDSDADEMVGEWAVLHVTQEVAQAGKKAGQVVNRVQGISAFVEGDWDFDHEDVPEDNDDAPVAAAAAVDDSF